MTYIRRLKYIISISCLSIILILILIIILDQLGYISDLLIGNTILLNLLAVAIKVTIHIPTFNLTRYYFYTGIVGLIIIPTIILIDIRKDRYEENLKLKEIILGLVPLIGLIITNLAIMINIEDVITKRFLYMAMISGSMVIFHPLNLNTLLDNIIQISEIATLALIIIMGIMKSSGYYENLKIRRTAEVKYTLNKLSVIYNAVSINDLSLRLKVPIQELKDIIEDLIYLGEIEGKIIGNFLDFTQTIETITIVESNLQRCILCNKPIKGEKGVFCPYCDAYAHKGEFLEWIKIKASCPSCKNKLNLWEFKKFIKKYESIETSQSDLCPYCKKLIPIDSFYCIFCGFKIKKPLIKE